jgi:maleate isomerase
MVYGCTSGTVAAGERMIAERLAAHRPGKLSTNPLTAAMAALRFLCARRIGLLTPYPHGVHSAVVGALASEFAVARSRCLGIEVDGEISRVHADAILDASRPLAVEVDALFLSCTSLRLAGSIDRFEAELGVPVVTSNQALAWHILQLVGLEPATRFGALMRNPAAMNRSQSTEESRLGR